MFVETFEKNISTELQEKVCQFVWIFKQKGVFKNSMSRYS